MKRFIYRQISRGLVLSAALGLLIFALGLTTYAQRKASPRMQSAKVVIGPYGYDPPSIRLKKGVPARVTFVRTTDSTCATEVVFADYGIRRSLPLNHSVVVAFTPRKAGEFSFTCGMNMHRGRLIVY
jgi:plastocyanin domain-containing protein